MSIFNQLPTGRHGTINARECQTAPYSFSDISELLLDTRDILPRSFTGASIDYPEDRLTQGDSLDVHLSAIVKKDFPAYVTEIQETGEGLRVRIEVDEKNFAVAALCIAVSPHPKNHGLTVAEGKLSIVEHHLPAPGIIIRAAAGRAISSFIDKTVRNVDFVTKDR